MAKNLKNQDKKYDLAVIGAGPAGSHAAALAAWAGLKTILIDKKQHPRFKCCGGFVSDRALGLLPPDLDTAAFRGEPVYRIGVKLGNEMKYHEAENRLGLLVKRDAFDLVLAGYAEQKGADLLYNHRLSSINRDDNSSLYISKLEDSDSALELNLKARFIIGADGAYSKTALLSGLRRKHSGLKGRGQSIILDDQTQKTDPGTLLFYPLPYIGGMGWSFHGSRWVNQGVGALSGWKKLNSACLSLFNHNNGELNTGYKRWVLPFRGPVMANAKKNIILIGDAAGLVDPFSGEGLYNSFLSSLLAVRSILHAPGNGDEAAAMYDKLFNIYFKNTFFPALRGAFMLHSKALLGNEKMPDYLALLMQNKLGFNKTSEYSSPYISVFDKVMDRS